MSRTDREHTVPRPLAHSCLHVVCEAVSAQTMATEPELHVLRLVVLLVAYLAEDTLTGSLPFASDLQVAINGVLKEMVDDLLHVPIVFE